MLRTITKHGIATGLHWTGLSRLLGQVRGIEQTPLVLCYHRVVKNFKKSSRYSIDPQLVSTSTFERQLDYIGRTYDFVSLDELTDLLKREKTPRRPVAAITFDDGYADVYRNAVPILTRKGIPSAVFVVTDLVGTSSLQGHDELYLLLGSALTQWQHGSLVAVQETLTALDLPKLTADRIKHRLMQGNALTNCFKTTRILLESLTQGEINAVIQLLREQIHVDAQTLKGLGSVTWDMLREMQAQNVTIGSHTRSHALLVNETPEAIDAQVRGSKAILEKELGVEIKHFAYPDGRFDHTVIASVAAAGFNSAYTICMHKDPQNTLLTIPRRAMWEHSCTGMFGKFSPSIMACQFAGLFEPAYRCRQNHQ